MAVRVEVTYADLDVMVHASGPYSPDVADDLTRRAYTLFTAALADVVAAENAPAG